MPVVHVTPGLLDVKSFTIMGLHAKPNTDNPIGKFGTGLKYAVATLLRLKCKVQLFVGNVEYEFYTKGDNFRGLEYEQVYMKKRNGILSRWQSVQMPFTLDYGKFWEAWQAFRELESNTRDEGGTTLGDPFTLNGAVEDRTVFIITGEAYESAYAERDKVFLPEALTAREGDKQVQVFNEPSKHLYWRGIRVYDLDKPSIYTYNILGDVELTEDRTLKYLFQAHHYITSFVARSKDTKLIHAFVCAGDTHFESKLDFDYSYTNPSSEFLEVVTKKRSRGGYVSSASLKYYEKYSPPATPSAMTLKEQIALWAYDNEVQPKLQDLLKYLLKCQIKEPNPLDDDIPF